MQVLKLKFLRLFVAISFTKVKLRLFQSVITDVFSSIHIWQSLRITDNQTVIRLCKSEQCHNNNIYSALLITSIVSYKLNKNDVTEVLTSYVNL